MLILKNIFIFSQVFIKSVFLLALQTIVWNTMLLQAKFKGYFARFKLPKFLGVRQVRQILWDGSSDSILRDSVYIIFMQVHNISLKLGILIRTIGPFTICTPYTFQSRRLQMCKGSEGKKVHHFQDMSFMPLGGLASTP